MAADGRWCHFGRNRGLPNVPVECTAAELWSVCPCFPTVKKAQFKENSARVAIIIVCNFVKFIRAYYNPTKARRSSARIWKLTYPTRVLTADRVGRVALARVSPSQCSALKRTFAPRKALMWRAQGPPSKGCVSTKWHRVWLIKSRNSKRQVFLRKQLHP